MAVDLVGIQSTDHLNRIFQLTNHDFAVSNFKQAVSILNRTGHARFRRGPSDRQTCSASSPPPREQVVHAVVTCSEPPKDCFSKSVSTSSRSTSSSDLASSIAGEGSVSNGKQLSSVAPVPAFSSRKPPLPTSHRKRCGGDRTSFSSLQGSGRDHSVSRGCHCCKRRKLGVKREVKRVPIIGSKIASIPADDYSWKKYGEKTVDGSRFPRVYYKCSSVRGCPARKCVDLAHDDSKMLIVTYDGEHRHSHAPTPVPASLTGFVV